MMSVKQSGIKYHFLSLWYDTTWYWTLVSQTMANTLLIIVKKFMMSAAGQQI